MLRRITTALFFLCGAVAAWLVVKTAAGFGNAQAGMSAGRSHGPSTESPIEAVLPLLLCSYFLVSAAGALLVTKKPALWTLAGVSYSLLVIAFLVTCVAGLGHTKSFEDFIGRVGVIFLLGAVPLLPWHVAWALTLAKAENVT